MEGASTSGGVSTWRRCTMPAECLLSEPKRTSHGHAQRRQMTRCGSRTFKGLEVAQSVSRGCATTLIESVAHRRVNSSASLSASSSIPIQRSLRMSLTNSFDVRCSCPCIGVSPRPVQCIRTLPPRYLPTTGDVDLRKPAFCDHNNVLSPLRDSTPGFLLQSRPGKALLCVARGQRFPRPRHLIRIR